MTDGVAPSATLEQSVRESVSAMPDKAAVELALTYAREIDLGGDLSKLGPALLACLTSLLLTPHARAQAMKGVQGASDKPASRIDEVRERRARKSRAADLDAATS